MTRVATLVVVTCAVLCAAPVRAAASIEWTRDFESALARAQAENRFVMVDFYTSWCTWCKVLDQKTYSDARVAEVADRMINVKVNADRRTDVARRYGVRSYPTVVFLRPDGRLRHRVKGYLPPDPFLGEMARVFETAGEAFAMRIRIDDHPQDADLRRSYAQLLALAGEYDQASAQLDTLVTLTDGDTRLEAELNRAVLWLDAGKGKAAAEALQTWLADNSSHPRRAEATYHLARARAQAGDTEQARQLYKLVENLAPNSWLADTCKQQLKHLAG